MLDLISTGSLKAIFVVDESFEIDCMLLASFSLSCLQRRSVFQGHKILTQKYAVVIANFKQIGIIIVLLLSRPKMAYMHFKMMLCDIDDVYLPYFDSLDHYAPLMSYA